MHKTFLSLGAIFGALAVCLGAFGAHGLRTVVTGETLTAFQTGVQYQMYHTLALLLIAVIYERLPSRWIATAGSFFAVGIFLFSGSLYLITLLKAHGAAVPAAVGVLTPAGGLLLITGWVLLLVGVLRK